MKFIALIFSIFSLAANATAVDCPSHYPNGSVLHAGRGALYYPNGALLRTGNGAFLYSNGNVLRAPDGTMLYPTVALLRSLEGRSLFYPDSTLMRFEKSLYGTVDLSGRVRTKVRVPGGTLSVWAERSDEEFNLSIYTKKFVAQFRFDSAGRVKCEIEPAAEGLK